MAFVQDGMQICETFHIFSQEKEDLFHCCVSVCGHVYTQVSVQGGQKNVLVPLKPGSCELSNMGAGKTPVSCKSSKYFNHQVISPDPQQLTTY